MCTTTNIMTEIKSQLDVRSFERLIIWIIGSTLDGMKSMFIGHWLDILPKCNSPVIVGNECAAIQIHQFFSLVSFVGFSTHNLNIFTISAIVYKCTSAFSPTYSSRIANMTLNCSTLSTVALFLLKYQSKSKFYKPLSISKHKTPIYPLVSHWRNTLILCQSITGASEVTHKGISHERRGRGRVRVRGGLAGRGPGRGR